MSNEYFTPPADPATGSRVKSTSIADLIDAVDEAFDNIPADLATTIASLVSGSGVVVSDDDTTPGYLNGKLTAGTGISLIVVDDGGNETLSVAVTGHVALTGNETVAGIKTFSSSPIVPTPTTDMQASTKKYVDDIISAVIPSGTSMLFNQASPPVSWTKKSDWAANASVIVGNTYGAPAGTDSPISWTTAIGDHTAHTHTTSTHGLTVLEMPQHSHLVAFAGTGSGAPTNATYIATSGNLGDDYSYNLRATASTPDVAPTRVEGSGNAHGHGNTGSGGPTTHTQDTYTPIYTIVIAATKNA